MNGKVYFIGAGPGKGDLITVRGARILKEADVIVYDYLVDKQLFSYIKDGAELICAGKLARKGKYSYGHPIAQNLIDNIIIEKVNEQKKVVRLKNGDPAFFSRFGEELRALQRAGIAYEVVPGVTAASAVSSFCGIPLTDRDHASSCTFITGHENPRKEYTINDWDALSKSGTLVVYMGLGNIRNITASIIGSGKSSLTPVAVVKDISLPTQCLVKGTLENIAGLVEQVNLTPPALVVIGSVVEMGSELNWLQTNRKVLFTGISEERYFLEENYQHIPLVKIMPLDNYDHFDAHLIQIRNFDWVVFTSRYGVMYFFERLEKLSLDSRVFFNIKIAAVGQSTAKKLKDYGLRADVVPEKESSDGLVQALKQEDIQGKKMFSPCSNLSDKGLSKALEKSGVEVITAVAYNNVMPKDLPDIPFDEFDEIVFTSPSTVRNFNKRYGTVPQRLGIRCIGDATYAAFENEFAGRNVNGFEDI